MSTVTVEHHQPTHSQNIALQRVAASREEIILLSHLLQASLVVERNNPFRQAVVAHPQLVRNMTIMVVILLSAIVGMTSPQISHLLGIF